MILFLLLFSISLTGCKSGEQRFMEAIPAERIFFIVHQEEVEHGRVLFYVPDLKGDPPKASFEAIFIKKTTFGWEPTFDRGGLTGTLEGDLYSLYFTKYSPRSPFPMLFGEITNPAMKKIEIEYGNGLSVLEPKIVTKNDKTFWFVFVDQPEEKETYIIKGYTADGELLETVTQESD